jgi:hypothetical protein
MQNIFYRPPALTTPMILLSIGVDINTGGHVFQLHFTNSTGMNEHTLYMKPTDHGVMALSAGALIFQGSSLSVKRKKTRLSLRL